MIARGLLAAAVLSSAAVADAAAPRTEERPAGEAAEVAVAPAEAADEPKEEKKICRTERVTGSLTRRSRVCLTESEWREVHDRTRRGLDEFVGSASGAPKCLGQGVDC